MDNNHCNYEDYHVLDSAPIVLGRSFASTGVHQKHSVYTGGMLGGEDEDDDDDVVDDDNSDDDDDVVDVDNNDGDNDVSDDNDKDNDGDGDDDKSEPVRQISRQYWIQRHRHKQAP